MPGLEKLKSFLGVDVNALAEHILHLLQTEGETALDTVRTAVTLIQAVRSGNYAAIWTALNSEEADVKTIADAIRAEFGIN